VQFQSSVAIVID